jgi:hypothetical protein
MAESASAPVKMPGQLMLPHSSSVAESSSPNRMSGKLQSASASAVAVPVISLVAFDVADAQPVLTEVLVDPSAWTTLAGGARDAKARKAKTRPSAATTGKTACLKRPFFHAVGELFIQ